MDQTTKKGEKPRYRHDCPGCEFLGRYETSAEEHDLYLCCDVTLVAVRSDEPEDTVGFFIRVLEADRGQLVIKDFPSIGEAHRLAKARGLI